MKLTSDDHTRISTALWNAGKRCEDQVQLWEAEPLQRGAVDILRSQSEAYYALAARVDAADAITLHEAGDGSASD